MSEERFFNQVKQTMAGYSPEVPQQVYGKMRRALWWSNFTKVSATRFNMWYMLLLLGAGAGTAYALGGNSPAEGRADRATSPSVILTAEKPLLEATCSETKQSMPCTPVITGATVRREIEQNMPEQETTSHTASIQTSEMVAPPADQVIDPATEVDPTAIAPVETLPVVEKRKKGKGLTVPVLKDEK